MPWQYYAHDFMPSAGGLKYGGDTTSTVYKGISEVIGNPPKDIVYLSRFLQSMFDSRDYVRTYLETHGYVKTKVFQDTKVKYWKYEYVGVKK
jgi:hypothetical protein